MAYAALVSLARTIELILNYHQPSMPPELKNQIISIDKYVVVFQTFLEDFPKKAYCLEGRIREVTHEAENIIEIMSEIIHKSYVGSSKSKGTYGNLHDVSQELKRVTKDMESITEEVMEIKDSITVKDEVLGDSTAASSSSRVSQSRKDAMVGFDDNLMAIKCRLCGESPKLEVVPIVGMGGIGKTTLARNAYDDPLSMEHFQIRVWVTVSQDYSVSEIVSGLIDSMKVPEPKDETIEEVKVYKMLNGRRYLIVLDDVWSIKAWDDLKMMFPDDVNGSRILLTTRLSDVASYADSYSPLHKMDLMDDDQSWDLLRQKMFKQDYCPVELEDLGKMIASSCKGLPLAIVVIAGLLTVNKTKAAWKNIAEDVKSAISSNDEQFDKILSLSYSHLPHHLRPCFLYMGGFPEDYKMRVSILTKLWEAEGFVKPNGSKRFEETAEEHVEDLVRRSLVLVTDRRSNGRIKSISIHDLMWEMCKRIAQEERFLLHVGEGMRIPRRVTTFHSDLNYLRDIDCSNIRTILGAKYAWLSSYKYFRLLRILDGVKVHEYYRHVKSKFELVRKKSVPSLPVEVFELFHLRYLAFVYPILIPAAISNLQNLQSLIFFSSEKWWRKPLLLPLPLEIWRLPQLRHLVLFRGLLQFEEGAKIILENLHTLSGVVDFICSEEILKMFPNLKILGISYRTWRYDDDDDEDYQLHNLVYLQQLESLKLKTEDGFLKVPPAFPKSLKRLSLRGLELPWGDMKMIGSLPNLEVLKLIDNVRMGGTWETTEGGFAQLSFLLIKRLDLVHWVTDTSHFPRLKCLVFEGVRSLHEIPTCIGEIPTLELIEVDKFLLDSAKQIQDDQQSCGNDALRVKLRGSDY